MSQAARRRVGWLLGATAAAVALAAAPAVAATGGGNGGGTTVTLPFLGGGGGGGSTTSVPRTTTTTKPTTTTTTTAPHTTSTTVAPTTTVPATTTTVPAATGALITGLDTYPSNQANAINELGRTPSLVNEFVGFVDSSGQPAPFPTAWADNIVSMGSTPMITWQPNLPSYVTTSVLTSLSNGSEDSYITSWAKAAAAVKHPVYVRLMHEFNGDWYPWGHVVAGSTPYSKNQLDQNAPPGYYPYSNTPAMYVAAFDHVASLLKAAGASNVELVWNEAGAANQSIVAPSYPGDAAVSWLSFDAYNRSATKPESPAALYQQPYATLTAISAKPIMVAETATVEFSGGPAGPTGSKAQWITSLYTQVATSLPHIRAINYFDSQGAGYSYPFDSSSSALSAIRQAFAASTSDAPAR